MNNNNGNGFSTGFLLGAIIGGAVVFFLGTEKGKKLLKTITDEGLENISDLKDFVEDGLEEKVNETRPETSAVQNSTNGQNGESKKPSIRRFFRRVPKKS